VTVVKRLIEDARMALAALIVVVLVTEEAAVRLTGRR
jgi:hypothetical protein